MSRPALARLQQISGHLRPVVTQAEDVNPGSQSLSSESSSDEYIIDIDEVYHASQQYSDGSANLGIQDSNFAGRIQSDATARSSPDVSLTEEDVQQMNELRTQYAEFLKCRYETLVGATKPSSF